MKLFKATNIRENFSSFIWLFIALYLLFSMISITISLTFLAISFFIWLIRCFQKKRWPAFPGFFWPLIVYAFLTLVSSFFSVDPAVSFMGSRELLLFLAVPIVYMGVLREKDLKKANLALLASAFINILYSIFYFLLRAAPEERITSFMDHYMTQAGMLLLFCSLALSLFLFSKEKSRFLWGAGFILALFALALTLTRSAWVGLAAAVILILYLYRPVTLLAIPVVLGLFLLLSPQYMKKRAYDIFSLKDLSNIHRIEYLKVGIQIIEEYPLFGTGPNMVDDVFQNPKYDLTDQARENVHLHNDFIQIAAERGIPALIAWLVFVGWAFVSLIRLLKKGEPDLKPLTVGALAALVAVLISGLFEYNFGDSEITILFLYILTLPFLLARIKDLRSLSPDPGFANA
jgi:O-antigen ligase